MNSWFNLNVSNEENLFPQELFPIGETSDNSILNMKSNLLDKLIKNKNDCYVVPYTDEISMSIKTKHIFICLSPNINSDNLSNFHRDLGAQWEMYNLMTKKSI